MIREIKTQWSIIIIIFFFYGCYEVREYYKQNKLGIPTLFIELLCN